MASVCDQANAATINALVASNPERKNKINSGQLLTYKLDESIVIHLYDAPHLLKGTRNNLQTKNLWHSVVKRWSSSNMKFKSKSDANRKSVASWKDVSDMYESTYEGSRKLLPKITSEHINPDKLKMKVSTACQVFSQTFGNVLIQCSKNNQQRRDYTGTGQILLFFNDLFDSVNGSNVKTNTLRSPVTANSEHFDYWDFALNELAKMKFVDKVSGKTASPTKNIQNWQSTIRGYSELSRKCLELGMKEIALR